MITQNLKKIMLLIAIFSPIKSFALDIDAQDYRRAPDGTNLFILYGQYAKREGFYNDSNKLNNGKLESDIGVVRLVHYTKVGSLEIAPQLLIPFGNLKASGDAKALGESSGVLGDIILANTFWLIDKPKDKYFGITPFIYLPTGSYKDESRLNIGENRFKTTLQASYLQYWNDKFGSDFSADATLYADNNDNVKGKIEQEMGYQLQADVFYNIDSKFTVSAGLSYADAGDVQVKNSNIGASTQSKIWAGGTYNINFHSNLLMTLGRDLDVENTFKENFRFNFRYVYQF